MAKQTIKIAPNNYVVFGDNSKEKVLGSYKNNKLDGIRAEGGFSDATRTRHPYSQENFNRARPDETGPRTFREVIYSCREAYTQTSVVRNVIDLMTDFACEDLRVIHPEKSVEAFFKVWMAKVKLHDAIDEFVRHFFVDGNVVVRRHTAKLSKPVENQWLDRAMAAEPEKLYKEYPVGTREIPWRYSFLNVAALYWIGGEEGAATNNKRLAFRVSDTLLKSIRTPQDSLQIKLVDRLPAEVKRTLQSKDLVELDMNQIYVAHNKKDTWADWAPPFLYSVLGDIRYKNKLRQAEISAMDGWLNVIRLWKLGDHVNGFLPSEAHISRLIEILENNSGGGTMDLVWDSLIDMQEFYPPVEKILGSEKYDQVTRDILVGLGVPEVLIGGKGANFSNSFIQLKTLVEKLKYVRNKLKDWLYQEVHAVCEAMDIKVAPKVRFNQINLEDENVSRKLIVGLLDRGVISVEAVLQTYGQDFLVEVERMRREKSLMDDAGIEFKGPFEQPPMTGPNGQIIKPKKKKNPRQPGPGRPSQTIDIDRDQRTPKPRRAAAKELTVYAMDILDSIDEYVIPVYMEYLSVANARKLTLEQKYEINLLRRSILASIKPDDKVDEDFLVSLAEKLDDKVDHEIVSQIHIGFLEFAAKKGNNPTLAQMKRIEAITWAEYYNER